MSIVSATVSKDNPITADDVHEIAAILGFKVDEREVEVHRTLLAAAYETFEELSALPDYDLPVDKDEFLRTNIRKVDSASNVFGNAWSYRFHLARRCPVLPPSSVHDSRVEPPQLLAGMNVVLKDNICVADVPQIYGTDAIEPWIPKSDATVVSRILRAGGCIVGTATCEAMSCATSSNTSSSGPIYNPWARGYSAGGSSSGVGALVGNCNRDAFQKGSDQEFRVDMGVGADQGGSIRVPAAFCGLVGLKATHGLIPYTGVTHCEATLDHVGPMCKTVWDTALLLEAIAGRDGIDDRQVGAQSHGDIRYSSDLKTWYQNATHHDTAKPLSGRRAAVITESVTAPFVADEMKEEVRRVAQQFRDLGATVDNISMPWHERGRSLWMAVCRQSLTSAALGNPVGRRGYYATGFVESLLPWDQKKWARLPLAMRNELINGVFEQRKYPALYAKCMNLTIQLINEYEKLFKSYDVLILPSVPFTAPPLFDRETATPWEVAQSTFGQTLNTIQFNLTGHPAMSMPTGLSPDMSGTDSDVLLPVSIQLVGPLHRENNVLEFGYAYERAYEWKQNVSGL